MSGYDMSGCAVNTVYNACSQRQTCNKMWVLASASFRGNIPYRYLGIYTFWGGNGRYERLYGALWAPCYRQNGDGKGFRLGCLSPEGDIKRFRVGAILLFHPCFSSIRVISTLAIHGTLATRN
jgi:hypothetical protein